MGDCEWCGSAGLTERKTDGVCTVVSPSEGGGGQGVHMEHTASSGDDKTEREGNTE